MNMRSMMAVALVLGIASAASAEMIEKKGRFGGLDLTYKVVLSPLSKRLFDQIESCS